VLTPSIDSITAPVRDDLAACNANMMSIVGERHPMLKAAAERIFGAGGKKLRPVLCFLVARATAQACGLR
jgi:all-trans-nonaprenyl-diphosphate synthase